MSGSVDCGETAHLIYAGVDHVVGLTQPVGAEPTRIVFVSTSALSFDSGIDAFDVACHSDWETANGVATGRVFRALLAGDGASAASRIAPSVAGTAASTCDDWSSADEADSLRVGRRSAFGGLWGDRGRDCTGTLRLYCAEDLPTGG